MARGHTSCRVRLLGALIVCLAAVVCCVAAQHGYDRHGANSPPRSVRSDDDPLVASGYPLYMQPRGDSLKTGRSPYTGPYFRGFGPPHDNGFAAASLTPRVLWNYSLPNQPLATRTNFANVPVVTSDGIAIYFAVQRENAVGHGLSYLIALDISTGTKVWSQYIGNKGTDGIPALTADGTLLYVHAVNGTLVSADPTTGAVFWTVPVEQYVEALTIEERSGAPARVWMHGKHSLVAVAADTGAEVWRKAVPASYGYASPTVVGDTVFITSGWSDDGKRAFAFSISQQSQLWNYTCPGPIETTLATDGNGVVYFACDVDSVDGGQVVALRADTGEELWVFAMSSFAVSSPTLSCDGKIVYAGCDERYDFHVQKTFPAHFYALSASDGSLLWQVDSPASIETDATIDANGVVYFASSYKPRLYAVDGMTGDVLWRVNVTSQCKKYQCWGTSSPVVVPGGILIGVNGDMQMVAPSPVTVPTTGGVPPAKWCDGHGDNDGSHSGSGSGSDDGGNGNHDGDGHGDTVWLVLAGVLVGSIAVGAIAVVWYRHFRVADTGGVSHVRLVADMDGVASTGSDDQHRGAAMVALRPMSTKRTTR